MSIPTTSTLHRERCKRHSKTTSRGSIENKNRRSEEKPAARLCIKLTLTGAQSANTLVARHAIRVTFQRWGLLERAY